MIAITELGNSRYKIVIEKACYIVENANNNKEAVIRFAKHLAEVIHMYDEYELKVSYTAVS